MDKDQRGGQARPGGERGINGAWYKGGQFIPASEQTRKGESRFQARPGSGGGIRRHLVRPGQREPVAPDESGILNTIFLFVDIRNGKLQPNEAAYRIEENDLWERHPIGSLAELQVLVDAYNRGERIYTRREAVASDNPADQYEFRAQSKLTCVKAAPADTPPEASAPDQEKPAKRKRKPRRRDPLER